MKTRQEFTVPRALPFLEVRATIDSMLPYAEHVHASFSLGIILAGQTCFSLGNDRYMAESGDIVLIDPGQAHSCNPVGMPRSYLMAYVDAAWFHGHRAEVREGRLRVTTPLVRDKELFSRARSLLDAVRAEYGQGTHADPVATEQELRVLLLHMQERHHCFLPVSAVARPGASTSEVFAPLATTPDIEGIATGEYSVNDLAHIAGVRRESFSRSFHRRTGLPPGSYMHCLRLEYGRRLLREGRSVAQAAAASGYADQSHFHRMFLKYCSVTPGCYRKNRAGNE